MATTLTTHPDQDHGRVRPPIHKHRIPLSNYWAKMIMAVTGLVFVAFVFIHMYGNLHIYFGGEEFDHYAHWLREAFMPVLPYSGLLWILRIVLLGCLVLHVFCALLIAARARRARGRFRRKGLGMNTFGARSMLVTGIVLLLFVIFHILDLTVPVPPLATDVFVHGEAYANLVASFSRPWASAVYIVAMLVLTVHIAHGVWTAAHDLGVTGKRTRAIFYLAGGIIGLLIAIGNITIPVAVLLGVLA
ncbi:succinate dehydrogenase cytochrome b subunit [Brevibacterium samyangense]|uniref:Succinate dehydrogenase cytochrome b subunit n=1 Tax=Brevibacterium samyangense TaxID=366888 RepID=A0ABN2TFE9_9MICO